MRSAGVRDHTAQVLLEGQWIRLVRHVSTVLFVAAVVGLGATAAGAERAIEEFPRAGESGTGSRNPGDEEDKWIEEFMEILRRLYEALGGDPRKLGNSPEIGMANVVIRVVLYGVPSSLTPTQTSAVLADIETLTLMLNDPPSSVEPGAFGTVLAEIASLLT